MRELRKPEDFAALATLRNEYIYMGEETICRFKGSSDDAAVLIQGGVTVKRLYSC